MEMILSKKTNFKNIYECFKNLSNNKYYKTYKYYTNNKYYTTIQHSLHKYGIQNSLIPNSDKLVGSKIKIASHIIFMP